MNNLNSDIELIEHIELIQVFMTIMIMRLAVHITTAFLSKINGYITSKSINTHVHDKESDERL